MLGQEVMQRRREKVCVFVDNCGLHSALQDHGNVKLDYKRLKDWLACQREVMVMRYYAGEIRNEGFQRVEYYNVLERAGYELVLAHNPSSEVRCGTNDPLVQAWCIANLIYDMCELALTGNYDTFVVVTGSSELSQIVTRIRKKGVDVEIIFFDDACDTILKSKASRFRPLNLDAVSLVKTKRRDETIRDAKQKVFS